MHIVYVNILGFGYIYTIDTLSMCNVFLSFCPVLYHLLHIYMSNVILKCRYVNMTQDLQRVDLLELSENEKLAFFLNLYNAMVIHAVIRVGCQEGVIKRSSFSGFHYLIGGYPYSLNTIKNGILRSNRRSPYSLVKAFGTGDRRLEVNCLSILSFG